MGDRIQFCIERCATCGFRRKVYPSRVTPEIGAFRACPNGHRPTDMMTVGAGHEEVSDAPAWPVHETKMGG